jgi:hypothetical protein
MERIKSLWVSLIVILVLGLLAAARPAVAQTKTAQGTVTTVSGQSLTVKVGGADTTFVTDAQTKVEAPGAGGQTRREGGVKVADYVKVGGNVLVTYREANGANLAIIIRPVASAGGSSGPETKIVTGTVKAVSAGSLTVTSDGRDMPFAINRNTRVLFPGAGRATRDAGGTIAITSLVSAGDTVSVSYTEAGGTSTASEVRVTIKAR